MNKPELTWRKSSFSDNGGNCVEVAATPGHAHVRDSKSPERGHLAVTAGTLGALLADVKAGRLEL